MKRLALTTGGAAAIAGVVAISCYGAAWRNGWAMDDQSIIYTNPAAHAFGEAAARFFEPYWPPESGIPAGQYRPLAIVWYAVDWAISGGDPSWFHGVNVILHGIATVLLVFVVAKWLPPVGALAAGLVFAVHPVHVEAVANVVGRSEVATAAALLAALLCARRFRRADGGWRALWLGGVLVLLVGALFVKENAVVLVALLLLDELADGEPKKLVSNVSLYTSVAAVTLAWLYLWQGVAGEFVSTSENPALRDASLGTRLSTMFPAYLHVSRLLTWPMELAPDYNPQMIPRRTSWSVMASLGLAQVMAILGLAWLLRKKAIAITVAILASLIAYAPTANLLFSSGVVLAERNLYLAVWAPAVVAGWLVCFSPRRFHRVGYAAIGIILMAFTLRTVRRVPDWVSTEVILTDAFAENGENFRGHLRIGSLLFTAEDYAGALAQALVAGEIFPDDPFLALVTTPLAFDLGYQDLALEQAERGFALGSDYPQLIRLAVRARLRTGRGDEAVSGARFGVERHPKDPTTSETYIEVLTVNGAEEWQLRLAHARDDWIHGRLGAATEGLIAGFAALTPAGVDPYDCWDLQQTLPVFDALTPDLGQRIRRETTSSGTCRLS